MFWNKKGDLNMTYDEYVNYKSLSPKERFFFLNEGSISERVKQLAEISDYEQQEQNEKEVQ